MENRQDEFKQLQTQALAILSDTTTPGDTHTRLLIRLHQEPSFHDFASWYVFADVAETTFVLCKTVWQRIFDVQRFRDPMFGLRHGWHIDPTTNITLQNIAVDTITPLLQEARRMAAPDPDAKRDIALDGMSCSLFVAGAFDGNEYAWNAIAIPQGWSQMVGWVERLLVVLVDD